MLASWYGARECVKDIWDRESGEGFGGWREELEAERGRKITLSEATIVCICTSSPPRTRAITTQDNWLARLSQLVTRLDTDGRTDTAVKPGRAICVLHHARYVMIAARLGMFQYERESNDHSVDVPHTGARRECCGWS